MKKEDTMMEMATNDLRHFKRSTKNIFSGLNMVYITSVAKSAPKIPLNEKSINAPRITIINNVMLLRCFWSNKTADMYKVKRKN